MAPINLIAVAAAACLVLGVMWLAIVLKTPIGRGAPALAVGHMCIPGLLSTCVGVALAIVNGFVAVLT